MPSIACSYARMGDAGYIPPCIQSFMAQTKRVFETRLLQFSKSVQDLKILDASVTFLRYAGSAKKPRSGSKECYSTCCYVLIVYLTLTWHPNPCDHDNNSVTQTHSGKRAQKIRSFSALKAFAKLKCNFANAFIRMRERLERLRRVLTQIKKSSGFFIAYSALCFIDMSDCTAAFH